MVYVFLADGFEEVEALAPVDIMMRAGIEVTTVGITGEYVTGSHGVQVRADTTEFVMNGDVEMIVLPGGGKGTANLSASEKVKEAIVYCMNNGVKTAAICAAPSVLGENGALRGRKATCFPEEMFMNKLLGAEYVKTGVCVDNGVVTGHSAGHSLSFGIAIVRELRGDEAAEKVTFSMYQNV